MPGSPVWPHARMAISFGETATWQLYFVLAVQMNPSTYLGTESERQGTRCVDHDDHSRVIGAPPMSLFRSCTLWGGIVRGNDVRSGSSATLGVVSL